MNQDLEILRAFTMQINLDVPDRIGEKLKALGDKLPEALDRILDELPSDSPFQDEVQILELLISQPSPESILALRPSPTLQARMSDLLAESKANTIDRAGEAELDRYLLLEHWIRLAKTNAYKQINHAA
jgi:hypothetical protein